MKTFLAATAIATCLASTAFAGALEFTPVAEAEIIAPAITDWSGPYAGALFATGSATQEYLYEGEWPPANNPWPRDDLEGTMYGAFAGYNVQRNSYVFGVEGAYSTGSFAEPSLESDAELTNVIDLKARAGIVAGDALIYGFAGWSMGDFTAPNERNYDGGIHAVDGMNYGAGVDFLVTDNIFVGAAYIVRDLSGAVSPTITVDLGVQALELRVGMNF